MKKHFLSFIVCIVLFASCDTDEPTNKKDNGIGKFSVSASKQVTFSPGNLQYTQSTYTWSFASAQYEILGTDNVTGGSVKSNSWNGNSKEGNALADKIDLFGWSTRASYFGVFNPNDYHEADDFRDEYSGSFVDWGTKAIDADAPNTWRTLSYDEWNYLLNNRNNASSLKGVAQVNGINGLILLPDNWICPAGLTFKSGFHSNYNDVDYYAEYQSFTSEQWSKLESAGAVFLPAAGFRFGINVSVVQYSGYYWSATEGYHPYDAFHTIFGSSGASIDDERGNDGGARFRGCSVRLVKDM